MADTLEKKPTRFQDDPLPFILETRNFIFGKTQPSIYTQITFYSSLLLWMIFFFWSMMSYVAISMRSLIYAEKGISVEGIVDDRGVEVGYDMGIFLERLLTFHGVSLICWGLVFVGLILLWRKHRRYTYFFFGGTITYFCMIFYYMGWNYYMEDTTRFDKVSFLLWVVSVAFYQRVQKRITAKKALNLPEDSDELELDPEDAKSVVLPD
jgi:hypothetical protein